MKICTRCVLPETFPGIVLDAEGVCQHCRTFQPQVLEDERERYRDKFRVLVDGIRATAQQRDCDAVVAYSGGKDSTYTLLLLKERYGLRVTAFTFDNDFISPTAWENMALVVGRLGVPHVVAAPPWRTMRHLFRAAAEREIFSRKSLERASTICTACSSLFKAAILRHALDNGIPLIGFGWSPGQAPVQSSVVQSNPRFLQMSQKSVMAPLLEIAGEAVRRYFLEPAHYALDPASYPWNIHPLAFEPYSEDGVKEAIAALGWVTPDDTDPNSTNCLLNVLANQVHVDRYGFHPYAHEIAGMVRMGVMDRAEGMEKIYGPVAAEQLEQARRRLDSAEE